MWGWNLSAAGNRLHLGIDIGSTTTKYAVLDASTHDVMHLEYRRHGAHQAASVVRALEEVKGLYPGSSVEVAVCGSGGAAVAAALDVPFVQEVVANAIAIRDMHPQVRCAIELGGQDAKMIFFHKDEATGALDVSDMRMNGSCAGGTGAFVDEIAAVLEVPVEGFDALAREGATVYDISGRCGVYAKTDIQPLLNQGVPRADLALSSMHAIAKQTIGGLAQGLDITAPVIFEGGPLTFNPTLVRVFAERLGLEGDDVVVPEHPEMMVAIGAALSCSGLFADASEPLDIDRAKDVLTRMGRGASSASGPKFFETLEERDAFDARHRLPEIVRASDVPDNVGRTVRAYLGIDSGSTTTKFALIDERERLIDEFYASNQGEPLGVCTDALMALRDRYAKAGVGLDIIACGTTGYGETLFQHAYHADCHAVETVAHATAACTIEPDASFILDIGGQDMKAIWLDRGVVSNITVNEACSSGCGSFLENFASSLRIDAPDIAAAAFRADFPAQLGSRCTVFMNSSIVSEQKSGHGPDDIMAGLCRSIIENVFTKVIRVSNLSSLGNRIVVQGGTFRNDAVLRALEQYLGFEVTRAPYPGLMGAIGVALLTKRKAEAARAAGSFESSFIGLEALPGFSWTEETGLSCPFCANHCSRTRVTFSDGSTFMTGNRCERGEVVGDPKDAGVRAQVAAIRAKTATVPNLFEVRKDLLFKDYDAGKAPERGVVIGLPRVLGFWDRMPFWRTLLRALGFTVKMSRLSTRAMYEEGLPAVASDTVCFPAKLVHGHIRDLERQGVDRIFFPIVTTVPTENTEKTSESMCAVVKGYPMVIANSDDPTRRSGIPFDDPLFHWYSLADRDRQLTRYFADVFGIGADEIARAIGRADAAQASFRAELLGRGAEVIDAAEAAGTYAVVLASRPYHNDDLVNHGIPEMFCEMGIPVLTPDAVPGAAEVDLSRSRLDVVNNFHARMLSTAILAAESDSLEYVQVVSFGCGHDAYLSDEIVRLMDEVGEKTPLIVKVDESDNLGPLRIRIRSFVDTIGITREMGRTRRVRSLSDPYPVKFTEADAREKVVLVPNTSHAFSRLMASVFTKQGVRAVPLPLGRERAIALGKRYVHNDICFPAQITIGETLAALESGDYDGCDVAVATGKYIGDCRLTHYAALLRRALDDAGYENVPIITNDDVDYHDMHPGFRMNLASAVRIAMGLPMIDALEEMLRKIRPYELEAGSADAAFDRAIDVLMDGIETHGVRGAARGFARAVDIMDAVAYDRSNPRPTVLIVGEYLLNFHPGANHEVERYLEANGLEVVEARMTDVIRKTYFYKHAQVREYRVDKPLGEKTWYAVADDLFNVAHALTDRIAAKSPLYEPATRMQDLVKASDPIIHHTFDAGEGVLIPGEILHHASRGCRNFVILQPFGCLPNHIVGRGIAKRLKEMYPDAQILPLDYDPDVSFANVENRLQMLIMNARGRKG